MSLDKLRAKRDEQAQAAERAEIRAKQAKARLQMADNRLSNKRQKLYNRERILAGIVILEAIKKHGQWEWWSQRIEASSIRDDEKQVLREMLTQRGVSGAASPANDAGSAPAPTPGATPPARRSA